FFRLLLAIPHFIWLALWTVAALVAAVANWFATLFSGRSPGGLHNFLARYVRYATHVNAFVLLAANPFPGFTGEPGSYPIDLEIDPPAEHQNRWVTGFRAVLALPPLWLAGLVGGGFSVNTSGSGGGGNGGGAAGTAAFLGWFASMVRGQMPPGLRNLGAYGIAYNAQAYGYLFLLTDRYPNSDPNSFTAIAERRAHPVRLTAGDDRQRSRLTVFFRLLLAFPHFVWLYIWGFAAQIAAFLNWLMILITGRAPESFHGFLTSYLRYTTRVYAYLILVANPYPPFGGAPGGYPVEVEVDPPTTQNRWRTFFRLLLALPAFLVVSTLFGVAIAVAVGGWFVALFTARMPPGLVRLGAYCLRYQAQVSAYGFYLLTDQYPYSGPAAEFNSGAVVPEPGPVPAPPAPLP
ncbi:MAG TPA: DUF4389 domain-containing protein, partial [Solirubrobacteraceae bacterium]|nr:DUF4389 domain-containing protein [Solirubrobacteraceae bacterium]